MFDIRPLMRLKETYPVPVRIPLADRIAHARRIIDAHQALLRELESADTQR